MRCAYNWGTSPKEALLGQVGCRHTEQVLRPLPGL